MSQLSLFFFYIVCGIRNQCREELSRVMCASLSPRETIQTDMEIWEHSGQWGFSCYSNSKASLSGLYQIHLII